MELRQPILVKLRSSSPFHTGSVFMHPKLGRLLGQQPGASVQLQFGKLCLPARVYFQTGQDARAVSLSADLLETMGLPTESSLHLWREGEKLLRLGPLVGILARLRLQDGVPAGFQVPVFTRLLEAAVSEGMFAYIFSPFSFAQQRAYVWGWYLDGENERRRWRRKKFPLPDVIYDQILSRRYAKQKKVARVLAGLYRMYQHRYFNPGFFDKWQVYTWLSREPQLKSYLPQTALLASEKKWGRFVEQHASFFIKPIHGSLGIGIIKLTRLPDGRYKYQIKGKKGVCKEGVVPSPEHIAAQICSKKKKQQYVIQQGLQLLTFEGRPFDIRILMQKDHTGSWRRTKAFCRLARQGDITSNLSTGGDALPLVDVLRKICSSREEQMRVQKKIQHLSRLLPEMIEQSSGLSLGELGLDIGMDEKHGLWLIEVNAKPWKKPVTENGSQQVLLQSFRRPMLYAKYLTGLFP